MHALCANPKASAYGGASQGHFSSSILTVWMHEHSRNFLCQFVDSFELGATLAELLDRLTRPSAFDRDHVLDAGARDQFACDPVACVSAGC